MDSKDDPGRSLGFSPSSPDFVRDPYVVYDGLRSRDPVHFADAGFWVLTRYEDVAAGLRDPRLSNSPAPFAALHHRNRDKFVAADVARHLIAFQDPPEHTAPRKIIATTFQSFVKTREAMLEDIARDCARSLDREGVVDMVRDFALPFATRALCRVMGFPEEDAARIKEWSGLFFYLFHAIPDPETLRTMNSAVAEFRDYVAAAVRSRRAVPRDDLVSALVAAWGPAGPDDGLADNLMLLAADGIENVWAGLASSVLILLRHPEAIPRIEADSAFLAAAVDECLRLESPGQYQGRIALETLTIGGRTIRSRSIVLLGLAAANRDPEAFPVPEEFRPGRKGPRRLTFGLGRHACLGGTLVNMELRVALQSIFDGRRDLALATSDLDWMGRAGHRWLGTLPVAVRMR